MPKAAPFMYRKLCAMASPALLLAVLLTPTLATAGQDRLSAPARDAAHAVPASAAPIATDKEIAATQDQLIKLLRESPKLTTVIEHDPSLLSNQEYVDRNNPQLGQFLRNHPEVARNPDYFLFTHLPSEDGHQDQALERAVWPELTQTYHPRPLMESLMSDLAPFLVFLCVCGVLVWLVRLFLDNRRWNRIFKMQTDVHGRLIERFGTNQELLTYMGTDAGKRFLEAAPLAVNFEQVTEPPQRMPSAVARILTPLQVGFVLTLLGAGILSIRHADPETEIPLLVLGTLILMPGIGFIISAGASWLLAGRLGLLPSRAPKRQEIVAESQFDLRDRQ